MGAAQAIDPEDERASGAQGTLAVASLVLGILALLLSPFLVGGLLGLVGITLAMVQMRLGRVRRALAVWGIALSLLGVAATAGAGAAYYHLYSTATDPGRAAPAHVSPGGDYDETLKAWEGQAVPALSLRTVVGGTVETEALKGRPLVLNFWATWCKACVEEIPDLNRLASDVTVIGISNEPEATLTDFMKTHPMRYIVVSADGLPAPFDAIPALPTTVFAGPDGVIRRAVVGGRDYETLKQAALTPAPAAPAAKGP
jgi:thiol-disulfide isomerase/thioredoxin